MILGSKEPLSRKIHILYTLTLFFATICIYLITFFYAIMFYLDIEAVRPYIFGLHPILILPGLASVAYGISGFFAVYLSKRNDGKSYTYKDLIIFFLMGLVINTFFIGPTIDAVLDRNGLNNPKGRWQRNVNPLRSSIFFALFGGFFIWTGYLAFLAGNILAAMFVTIGLILLLPIGTVLIFQNWKDEN